MVSKIKLFRDEVLESHRQRSFGTILLIHPISNLYFIGFAFLMLGLLAAFLTFGEYTRHETVAGVLEPSQGVIKLYALQRGVLTAENVHQGQIVHKGDVLLVFSSEHEDKDGKAMEAESIARLHQSVDGLQQELENTLQLHQATATSTRESLAAALTNKDALNSELQSQLSRVKLAEQMVERYEHLSASGFAPAMLLQQQRDALLDQQIRMQDLRKLLINADAEITKLKHDVETNPMRIAVSKSQMQRNIAATKNELSRQENERDWSLVAPCDGTVTSLNITHNQTANTTAPLVTIVPKNSKLQGTLYAASRSVGFLRAGQTVKIRLDAFPFQKFGFVTGKINEIAATPILASEVSNGAKLGLVGNANESVYTIAVELDDQTIEAYERNEPLRPGMLLTADIELETRGLYEWVLEPLFSR